MDGRRRKGSLTAQVASAALVLLAPLACSDGDGGATTTAGSGTSASTTQSQSTSETTTGTSTTATGGSASASATQGTTSPGTTTTTTSGTTTTTSAGATTEAMTGGDTTTEDTAGTTGGGSACVDLGDVDFGDCEAIVGFVFDGEGCVLRSGCGCEPHCDDVFASADACALACAGAGVCDADKMKASGIAADPFVVGSFCDGVYICGGDEPTLAALFPGQPYEPQGGYPCEGASMLTASYAGEVDAAAWEQLCAASLLPGVTEIHCTIWGP